MSDRKYRQRGYMDGDRREARPAPSREPRPERVGPRPLNMPGFREVVRCRCGGLVTGEVEGAGRCTRCGADLRACVQCTHFDSGSRFECRQPIAARVGPKDTRNDCASFEPQRQVERETGSAAPSDARKAFDDLFK